MWKGAEMRVDVTVVGGCGSATLRAKLSSGYFERVDESLYKHKHAPAREQLLDPSRDNPTP